MLKTELKLPFVFYNALNKQHRFRLQNNTNETWPLISQDTALLPFQIKVPHGSTISSFRLYNLDGTTAATLSSGSMDIVSSIDATWFIYYGDSLGTLPHGKYYAVVGASTGTWYSEIFRICDFDFTKFVEIRWTNFCDIDPVIYQTGYFNKVYLETYVEAISPDLAEEGEENGFGEFIPTFQRFVAKNKIELVAPDYLLDALSFMQMHDTVSISDFTDTEVPIKRIKVTSNYGDTYIGTSKIEFEFEGDYVKSSCCNNVDLSGGGGDTCPIEITNITANTTAGLTTVGFTPVLHGATLDHYQWRSTDVDSNAWHDIGSSTTFDQEFTPDISITVDIEAICDNAATGTISSHTFTPEACDNVIIPTDFLPNGVVGTEYDVDIVMTGSLPIDLTSIVKPDWMTIDNAGGTSNTVHFGGTPLIGDVGTGIEVSFAANNCVSGTDSFTQNIDVVDTTPVVFDIVKSEDSDLTFQYLTFTVTLDRAAEDEIQIEISYSFTDETGSHLASMVVTILVGDTEGFETQAFFTANARHPDSWCVASVLTGTVDVDGFAC